MLGRVVDYSVELGRKYDSLYMRKNIKEITGIRKVITTNGVKGKNGKGPEDIPIEIIKLVNSDSISVLCDLVNATYMTGVITDCTNIRISSNLY